MTDTGWHTAENINEDKSEPHTCDNCRPSKKLKTHSRTGFAIHRVIERLPFARDLEQRIMFVPVNTATNTIENIRHNIT
jgi:hypothetical protein